MPKRTPGQKKLPSYYQQPIEKINFRKGPELYPIGKGEQGVLMVEPYKSEILPYWKFRTPELAQTSAQKIFKLFLSYKLKKEFVGMDMSRKFLQMGFTRARRYANHPSGRKYHQKTGKVLPSGEDSQKSHSAKIFYGYYLKAREDRVYQRPKLEHQRTYEIPRSGKASEF